MEDLTEIEARIPSEPPYAKKPLERGEVGIGDFHGQTLLFIPLSIYNRLGEEMLWRLAESAFGSIRIKTFGASGDRYKNSFLMELPPKTESVRMFLIMIRTAANESNR